MQHIIKKLKTLGFISFFSILGISGYLAYYGFTHQQNGNLSIILFAVAAIVLVIRSYDFLENNY